MRAYGAYGEMSPIVFNTDIFPLLQNGFAVAFAHVRGGIDKGMEWYHDGKLLNKKNSINDFIDVSEKLIRRKFGENGEVVIDGRSAGGLLIAGVLNERPDLYGTAFLEVPFVDLINTMLDDKLPLTVSEYSEWGNPNEIEYFNYMRSYSPYDNVKKQHYPAMFYFANLKDRNVGYWEASKMVAKLREFKEDDNPLLLKINYFAGHGGREGRFKYMQDLAYKYALLFNQYAVKLKFD